MSVDSGDQPFRMKARASVQASSSAALEVTLGTMRRHCDMKDWAEGMGYTRHFPLPNDYHVRYFRSKYRGKRCYCVAHS